MSVMGSALEALRMCCRGAALIGEAQYKQEDDSMERREER